MDERGIQAVRSIDPAWPALRAAAGSEAEPARPPAPFEAAWRRALALAAERRATPAESAATPPMPA